MTRDEDTRRAHELRGLIRGLRDGDGELHSRWQGLTDRSGTLALAERHGLALVLLHRLADRAPDAREELASREMLARSQGEWAKDGLRRVLDAMRSSSIEPVALKGVVLAERLYPEAHLRPTTDIDLLVSSSSLEKAAEALAAIGYAQKGPFISALEHHAIFLHPRAPTVELHYRLHGGLGRPIEADRFVERSIGCPVSFDPSVRVLRPEDELFFLAIHAATHRFIRWAWLLDIALLIDRGAEIKRARDEADHHRLRTAFELALSFVKQHTGIEIDPRTGWRARWGTELCRRELIESDRALLTRSTSLLYSVVLGDRPSDAFDHLRGKIEKVILREAPPTRR